MLMVLSLTKTGSPILQQKPAMSAYHARNELSLNTHALLSTQKSTHETQDASRAVLLNCTNTVTNDHWQAAEGACCTHIDPFAGGWQ